MSSESEDEIKRLKKEIEDLKSQIKRLSEERPPRRPEGRRIFTINIGEALQDYVEEVVQGVMDGISGEIERSVLIGPRGIYIGRREGKPEVEEVVDWAKMASMLSALANEHRIKILAELMKGGRYAGEIQERLPEITASTLSSHLKILEESGLIVQEMVRGRYLITMPGRAALKMASQVMRMMEMGGL